MRVSNSPAAVASTTLHAAAKPPRTPGIQRVNMTAALFSMAAKQ